MKKTFDPAKKIKEAKKWQKPTAKFDASLQIPQQPSAYPNGKVQLADGQVDACCGITGLVWEG